MKLPAFIRRRIEHRPNLQKALANTGWLFADRILRMGMGLLVGVWVARYLGPEQFGLFNYASAFVALFGAIATLGLNGIVVRELVKQPEDTNTILGTAFTLQLIGGLLAFGVAVLTIGFVRPDDALAKLMVAVLGFVMVFKATEVVKYWFESQVHSKYTVWVENAMFLVFAGIKVVLILSHASLMCFVWAVLAEAVLVAAALLGVYVWRVSSLRKWQVQIERAKALLKDSWPLILSGLAVMVYMRIDQIMLGKMIGDEAVGIYSAAVRISEVWYFIPMAIVASVFPSIIEAKKQSEVLYYQRLQQLYNLMALLAFSVAVPMTFLSDWVIYVLFGSAYQQAGAVLAIHIWAGIFVFLGVASGNWLLLEGYQRDIFYRTLLGMVANIFLNILLIPIWGVQGAAIATVISYFIAVFSVLIKKETRIVAIMMIRAITYPSYK